MRDALGRPFWLDSADPAYGRYYSSYRPDGLPAGQSRGNGASTWTSRDGALRLNGLGHYYGGAGASDVLWLYAHNPASQIRTVARDNDAYAWTGHYAVNRAYTTNGLNQYSAAGGVSFGYDANGNLTSDGSRTYVYDVENRLVSATPGATLSYDPLGRLYQVAVAGGATTRFLYDGDALVAEYNGAGAITARYVHWDGADVPIISYTAAGAALTSPTYLHADHQGSIIAVSGAAGAVQINRYDEYGIPAATNAGRFQYTGQAWLPELGLYYYKARIYSPTLGRFMQTDPVGYQDQFNLYAYVGNDPVNRSDPSGQYECRTTNDCAVASRGVNEITAARNFYRSPVIGSRIARAEPAARALDKVLWALGTRGDGGVNISAGSLSPSNPANYSQETNTITLDRTNLARAGLRIGDALAHETQHYRQRNENLSPLAEEARPIAMEYIMRVAPGGSINGRGISSDDYIRGRLNHDYCRLPAQFCNPAVDRVMNDELQKPF